MYPETRKEPFNECYVKRRLDRPCTCLSSRWLHEKRQVVLCRFNVFRSIRIVYVHDAHASEIYRYYSSMKQVGLAWSTGWTYSWIGLLLTVTDSDSWRVCFRDVVRLQYTCDSSEVPLMYSIVTVLRARVNIGLSVGIGVTVSVTKSAL